MDQVGRVAVYQVPVVRQVLLFLGALQVRVPECVLALLDRLLAALYEWPALRLYLLQCGGTRYIATTDINSFLWFLTYLIVSHQDPGYLSLGESHLVGFHRIRQQGHSQDDQENAEVFANVAPIGIRSRIIPYQWKLLYLGYLVQEAQLLVLWVQHWREDTVHNVGVFLGS